jgi:hypothetical protein
MVVVVPDVYEGFILWVLEKVGRGLEVDVSSQDSEKENQCLVLMVHTLFTSIR